MNEHFQRTIVEVAERLLHAASTDDRLRSNLRLCAEELLALTADAVPPAVEETLSQAGAEQTVVDPAHSSKPRQVAEPFNLAVTQSRLALKAEVARWAAERPHRLGEGADLNLEIRPQDQEFIRRAKEQGCYLWMLDPKRPHSGSLDQFTLVAAWYENLAEALGLLDLVIAEVGWQADEITVLLELAAVSQSALWVAVGESGGFRDEDQRAVFDWLRGVVVEHRIFIRAGMMSNEPTNPSEWAAVTGRIHAIASEFQERQDRTRKRKKLLSRVKHKASLLAATLSSLPETWGELMAGVDELVKGGVPASNKELREAVMPILDRLPAQAVVPDGFRLAVREIEKFKQTPPLQEAPVESTKLVPVVLDACKLLDGRSAVLIGGDERSEAKAALERALGLKELIWIGTSKHVSYRSFESAIARPDVAVVLLAIRWSSHSYGEVVGLCDAHGKPLVRLPGGYNPNQVAEQIVTQAGKRLVKP